MGILRLDFETRSPVDIKSSGPWRYAEDPRTEILCMAYKLDDEYTKLIPYEDLVHGDVDFPELDYAIENCYVFEAHNAEFERAIWTHKLYHMLRSRHLCPSVDQWSCTAARAAALSLPRSLEGVAAALHLPIQKDMKGRALMLKMSKPRKPTKADPYSLYHSGKDDLNRLYQYCINDVNTEYEVSKHLPELQGEERQVWILDQQMNEHGVLVDIEAVERIKNSVEVYVDNLVSELPALTNGVVTSVGQVARIAEFCGLKSANAASVEDALKSDSMDPKAKKVLSIRQVCSKTSTKKYNRMMDQVCKDGRLKSNLRIYAAGTGRWGGRGVQLQNLPRGKYKDPYLIVDCFKKFDADFIDTLWGDAMGAASTAIRSTLIAPEDHTFLCADFAQIEARVLAWLAGEVDLLRIFRSGQDVYRDMASTIFSMPSADIGKDSFERFVGKTAVLGLGYQMGSDKFRQTCIDAGQDIPRELAQKTVDIYRKKYGRIKDFWKNTEKAAIAAVETGVPQQVGKVTFSLSKSGKYLFCVLPSGRSIAYYEPQVLIQEKYGKPTKVLSYMGEGTNNQWERQYTYGGKLVENITQATSRDIMRDAMLRLARAGYRLILTVHDELIAEVKKQGANLEEFVSLMQQVPAWAIGTPIKAEGWAGDRYKK